MLAEAAAPFGIELAVRHPNPDFELYLLGTDNVWSLSIS